MFNQTVSALISIAKTNGISFAWDAGLKPLGQYSVQNGKRKITIRKGLSLSLTEETLVHEIAHALWDLSLPKGKRKVLKEMKKELSFAKRMLIKINYKADKRENEFFAYHMETRPKELLDLFQQIL